MIEVVSRNLIVNEFLSKYPESVRKLCAEAAMIYGVQTIKNKFPYGLSANQLLSISGMTDYEESNARIASSCNISIANNRSIEAHRLLSESTAKYDEPTDRFRESRKEEWKPAVKKRMSRMESEKGFRFSNQVKEPDTCPYETAQKFFYKEKDGEFQRESEVMKIADEFLKNSYTTYLRAQGDKDNKRPKGYQVTKRK